MNDYAGRIISGLHESLVEMNRIINAENLKKEAEEVEEKSKELTNLAKGTSFLANTLENKYVELRQRVRAMKLLLNDEYTELKLSQFEWVTELEVSE